MKGIYQSPFRVYLILGALALLGIFSGVKLPVSLFPNSSKPQISVRMDYGGITPDQFLKSYGEGLEQTLRAINFQGHEVEKLTSSYDSSGVFYSVSYKWGTPPREALKETQNAISAVTASYPEEIRDTVGVWSQGENAGFLAISFYSQKKTLDELYKYLDPILTPKLMKVTEAAELELWNPTRKEIRVELNPEKMAQLQVLPRDVTSALNPLMTSYGGGTVTVGLQSLPVTLGRPVKTVEDLNQALISSGSGLPVHLGDIAKIELGVPISNTREIRTSGSPSLILFASPRPGGNVKKMSEDILAIVREVAPTLDKDVEFRNLVDPSEFIRSAVNNVLHEVVIAALLAVLVLFLFIGSFKNVFTAAIEIPMSIVLAFILMKLTGINLNIISLGGLALSAGMNVDASVVVMENIFRHFEHAKRALNPAERLQIVMTAVSEVKFPVIASTIASLVVFLPLAFTSALTSAILGDLALAVIFSHGFSALVALVLVPTVRLHMMNSETQFNAVSPIEKQLKTTETFYEKSLQRFLTSSRLRQGTYAGLIVALGLLLAFALPRLPREVIGTPDTDWVLLALNTQGNTAVRQMSSQAEEIESGLLKEFGSQIQYTFTQIRSPNRATIMARLHDKKDMMDVWKKMEARFTNTPYLKFSVFPWNPSELPIPNPPHLRLVVRGGEPRERSLAAKEILDLVQEKKIFPKSWSEPEVGRNESVVLTTNMTQWSLIRGRVGRITPADVADLARVANQGRRVGELTVDQMRVPINLAFTEGRVSSVEDLAALPVGLDQKIVPLKALAQFEVKEQDPMVYREDGRELMLIQARLNKGEERKVPAALKQAGGLLEQWTLGRKGAGGITAALEPASVDLDEALSQLGWAIAISVLLIFLVMVFQFGDVANSLLVLVSVPLGFIGVVLGLFVFQSTLSLNSALGVILLNGIAVANSIILVDFLKKKYEGGMSPREAALVAARSRLRPILMTSLTTGLGMAPIALGLGEGGRILQPLGIAVIGGLGFSMLTTLFTVPALQVAYLEWRDRRAVARRLVGVAASVDLNQQEIAMANQEALQMKPIMEKNLQQDLANQEIALANREAAQSVKTLVTGRDVTKADSNPPSLDI